MANFNAGAIEGTLTLDRSPFNKDLKEAMAAAKKFEQEKIKIPLEIEGLEKIDELKAKLDALGDETVNVELDVDNADAIGELEARLAAIRDEVVTIEVDADASGAIAELEAELAAIPDETVTIEVDTDKGVSAMRRLAGERDHIRGMTLLVGGLVAILPAIVPVATSAAAALGALVSTTSILAAGLGIFAAVAIPAWKAYSKALKEADGDMSKLSPQMRALKAEQDNLNKSLAGASAASNNRIYAVIGGGMRLLATIISQSRPLIDAVTIAISQLVTQLLTWAQSPALKQVVTFLATSFGPAFQNLTGIIGNLIKFLAGITVAFEPFSREFMGGLKNITAAWATWANSLGSSQKFQDFLAYVRDTGPKVIQLFTSVSSAIGNIGKALAPLGGGTLDVLISFFNFLGGMNTSVLGALVVGIGTFVVAVIAATAAMAAFDAVAALNPFVAIAIAIIALVAAFTYLWKTNEGFRNFFITTWNAIWGFMKGIGAWFAGPFAQFFVAAFNGIVGVFSAIGGFFASVWNGAVAIVSGAWNGMIAIIVGVGGAIKSFVTTIWNGIVAGLTWFVNAMLTPWRAFWGVFGGLIKAALGLVVAIAQFALGVLIALFRGWMNITKSVITTGWNLIKGFLIGSWNAIKGVATAVWGGIKGFIIGSWNALKSAASSVWNGIKGVITSAINAVKGPVMAVVNGIKDGAVRSWNDLKAATSKVWNGLVGIVGPAIDKVFSKVKAVVDKIKGIFSGAASWLIDAGKNIIKGLIQGIESMIGAVTAKLKALTDKIPKVKGPEEVDKKLLKPNGRWIMQGFIGEIDKGIESALDTLSGFTGRIPSTIAVDQQLALAPNASTLMMQAQGGSLSKTDFIAAMSQLIEEIRRNTQPLIGQYNDAHQDPAEIAEAWWFATKGR